MDNFVDSLHADKEIYSNMSMSTDMIPKYITRFVLWHMKIVVISLQYIKLVLLNKSIVKLSRWAN